MKGGLRRLNWHVILAHINPYEIFIYLFEELIPCLSLAEASAPGGLQNCEMKVKWKYNVILTFTYPHSNTILAFYLKTVLSNVLHVLSHIKLVCTVFHVHLQKCIGNKKKNSLFPHVLQKIQIFVFKI